MAEKPQTPGRSITPDWLVQGVLTNLGDAFDRLLGRGWKPSSSLATSELIERLKALLDAEAVGKPRAADTSGVVQAGAAAVQRASVSSRSGRSSRG